MVNADMVNARSPYFASIFLRIFLVFGRILPFRIPLNMREYLKLTKPRSSGAAPGEREPKKYQL